jgi:hypothetical protein
MKWSACGDGRGPDHTNQEAKAMQATAVKSHDDESRVLGAQMARLGVRLLNKFGRVLQCESCDATWSPRPAEDGSLPRGFWRCPNRCNW